MNDDKEGNKKGFSGLSDLTSDIEDTEDIVEQVPAPEASPRQPREPSRPRPSDQQQRTTSSNSNRTNTNSNNRQPQKSGSGFNFKWILILFVVFFIIWFYNRINGSQSSHSSYRSAPTRNYSYTPPPTSAPAQNQGAVPNTVAQYTIPPVGTNLILSESQIRWCLREHIRLETMPSVLYSNTAITQYNMQVNNYNSRCGSYRYRSNNFAAAQRDVNAQRSQIVDEAIRDASQMGR